jgi:hypothetical protein
MYLSTGGSSLSLIEAFLYTESRAESVLCLLCTPWDAQVEAPPCLALAARTPNLTEYGVLGTNYND